MLPSSSAQDGLAAAGAGMDHTKAHRVPSLASWGQLRPHLQVPADTRISLPVQNVAAVSLALSAPVPGQPWAASALLELLL